jgi:hypothetical protein
VIDAKEMKYGEQRGRARHRSKLFARILSAKSGMPPVLSPFCANSSSEVIQEARPRPIERKFIRGAKASAL